MVKPVVAFLFLTSITDCENKPMFGRFFLPREFANNVNESRLDATWKKILTPFSQNLTINYFSKSTVPEKKKKRFMTERHANWFDSRLNLVKTSFPRYKLVTVSNNF